MEQEFGMSYTVMSKKEIKKCRHKSELRWYRFLVILNLLIIIGVSIAFVSEVEENKNYYNKLADASITYMKTEGAEADAAEKEMDELIEEPTDSLALAIPILFFLIIFPIAVYYFYAQYRSMSLRITEKNFPEIYEIVQEFSAKLGLKKVPKVYMVQGNGILNAFSAFVPFKQYVELYADLVEVAYREHEDMDALRFIIAHEMSHIYFRHATLSYSYSILLANMIPILSSTASRAREYSCDRLAQKLSGSDGIDAMMTLTTGIHLYKKVDKEDYINYAKSVKGFFVWCYNLWSSHPVLSKRIMALQNVNESGKLY